MASHDDCAHGRTPRERAICRAQRVQTHVDDIVGAPPIVRTPPERPAKPMKFDVVPRARKRGGSAGSVALKRPGTRLRTIGDLTDVPPLLASVVRKAWEIDGWEARVADPFNDGERRIVVATPHGELSLCWLADTRNMANRWIAQWRPNGTSVFQRITTVNGALRLANGEEE